MYHTNWEQVSITEPYGLVQAAPFKNGLANTTFDRNLYWSPAQATATAHLSHTRGGSSPSSTAGSSSSSPSRAMANPGSKEASNPDCETFYAPLGTPPLSHNGCLFNTHTLLCWGSFSYQVCSCINISYTIANGVKPTDEVVWNAGCRLLHGRR